MLIGSVLDDLSPVVGFTATLALAAWWADRNLYVPASARPDHPLAAVIGLPALRALVAEFGGQTLAIPADVQALRFRRDRAICERFAEGWTPARVADEFELSPRRAEQLRADLIARGWLDFAAGRLSKRAGL